MPDVGTGEKLFTQEDMDRVAETAKQEKLMEIQPQLDQLNADLAAAKAEIDVLKVELEAIKADVQKPSGSRR
jgi:multidrug resistance efflux pump